LLADDGRVVMMIRLVAAAITMMLLTDS
jgi:hypothetical protein